MAMMDAVARLRGWRADLAAAAMGALSAAALPPVHAIPVLLLTVPALLALIGSSRNWRVAARRGFWFGFGHHLFGLYWITEAILIEAARYWWFVPLAVPALSALLALFIAVPCALSRAMPEGWRRAFLLAGLWVLSDIARQFIGTGFPWNLWGSVWAIPGLAGDVMIQPAAWIGVPGMTLVTLLLAATPAMGWRAMTAGVACLALWAAFGMVRIYRPMPPTPGITAVLVQGNVTQGVKWDRDLARETFQRHLDLTRAGVAEAEAANPRKPVVVVWPESSSPYLLDRDANARAAIWEASRPALAAIVGSIRFDAENRPRNSMFALTGEGPPVAVYDKWHLVPFGEFAPSWVPVAVQVVPGGGFAFGSGPATLHVPGLPPFGGLICYEAIYPAQIVDEADRPAWLVNITNDAWFGNSSGPRQHLANVRLRAVEEGLPLVRAANTGITAAFDERGHELARLPRNTAAFLDVDVPGAGPPTPFSRWGLVIPALLSFAVIGLGLGIVRKRTAGGRSTT
jgi:apolipoprotein N-acyltransferase